MTVDSVVQICNGVLITPPSISSFTSIAINLSKVTRGCLFIAIDHNDIAQATQMGAYGIIFDKPTQILDNEIAWIKVESIQNTLSRFLRFYIMSSPSKFYLLDSFEYEIIQNITNDNRLIVLKKSLITNFTTITSSNSQEIVFVSKDKTLLENIAPDYIDSSNLIEDDYDLIRSTVFETSFRYHKRYYEFVKIPKFFIDEFIKVLSLLDRENIRYDLDSLEYTKHFHPVFVNKFLKAKEFGESDRVIIFEPNDEYIDSSIKFLDNNLKWAECLYVFPTQYKQKYVEHKNSYFYDNKYETIEFLKNTNFNFAYIAHTSYSDWENELTKETKTQGLFYV
jgi:ferrochelatase